MSEVKKLRSLIEDLVFFIENQDHYTGDLTEEGVRRSGQDFIVSRIKETVTWTPTLDVLSLTKETHEYHE
jgi:hypothetical protein